MKEMKVRLTFTEEILGTAAADKEIHKTYIASMAPNAPSKKEEVEAIGVEAAIEKGMTIFPRNKEGVPIYWDYQIKGFFKDAAGMLRKVPGTKSSKIKAYKKEIDGLIFVKERQIPIHFEGTIGNCERPLRGQTPQGEKTALANSESIPAGAWIEFTVQCLTDTMAGAVAEWFDYGALRGLGQWRNSGKGRYLWDWLDEKGNVIGGNYRAKEKHGKNDMGAGGRVRG